MPQQNHSVVRNADTKREKRDANVPRDAGDRLYRAASESVRQRERYARLVESAASEEEQQAVLRVACLCDEVLGESMSAYEKVVTAESAKPESDWSHHANALWHASREYARRHHNCDESSRQLSSRKPDKFRQLALEYDLEASALLALRLSLAEYRKVCPNCALEDRQQSFVA
jgi:hypothetical protein